ncbi:UNVERIFIED_CONTAM: Hexose carrier protein HEX6 [Sesamum angustifolium]|uniref:Hexose carrier protein HEX6 n=1 Tax=Sesamum angustifolium TaxID=2727405 RepID=A0AAW2LGP9_9LAMI
MAVAVAINSSEGLHYNGKVHGWLRYLVLLQQVEAYSLSVPLYLSEMAPPKSRGAFNCGFQLCIGIGGALFLPETPNSLIQQGRDNEKAKRLLGKIRGTDDVQEEFDDLVKAITGINVISFYAPILFMTIGSGVSASLMSTLILGIVATSMTVVSSFVVDKLGRRAIFHAGGITMFVTQVLIGGIMAAKLGEHGAMSEGYNILVVVLICIYSCGFAFSWGPLGWLVTSEIFPLEIRSAAQSINVGVSFFSSALIGQTFLSMPAI